MTTYRLSEQQRAQAKRYFARTFGVLAVVQIGLGSALRRWDSALAYPAMFAAVVLFLMATARFSFTEHGVRWDAGVGGGVDLGFLQHADNPVDWYPWVEEAFVEARRRDVPLLISFGCAACHWCHVMR